MKMQDLLEGIDYTQPGPITKDSAGQKLEYGIPVNAKGDFIPPNQNLPDDEYMQQLNAYKTWKADYLRRWPNATQQPDGSMQGIKPGLAAPKFQEGYNDYHNNRTGFSRHRREEDEANLMYIYDDGAGRLKQRMVSNHEEHSAHQQGFRQTPEAALKVHNIIRSKFDPKKFVQNQGGKWVVVHPYGQKDVSESSSVGSTSAGNIASVEGGAAAYSKGPVKSVNALDQDEVSLFGGPMEDIKTKPSKKVAIIKRR